MATTKLGFLERTAVRFGPIYRYQKLQFPRRKDLLLKVLKRELAPPTTKDLPAIQKDFAAVTKAIETKAYKNYTLGEALVYAGVAFEVVCWFFLGEAIGRRNPYGYVVPATYVSKAAKKKAAEIKIDDKTGL